MAMAMMHSRLLPLSAHSSHLRNSHLPARACSTGLASPHVLRARYAVHPPPLPTRLLLLSASSSNGNKTDCSDGNLTLSGGGCRSGGAGGGGDSSSSKPGSGDEDDRSGESFGLLNCIVKLIRRLLQLVVEPLLVGDFLATIHSSISIGTEEMQCPSSSHSTHEINLMGDEGSHCDGFSNDQLEVIFHVHGNNQSGQSSMTTSKRNKYSSRTAQVVTGTDNSQGHRFYIHISNDHPPSDENEKKMKGRRSYVTAMAASSIPLAGLLFPYYVFYCSDATLSIPKIWTDVLPIGYFFLLFTAVTVTAVSSQFKDGELPDNARFKVLQIALLVVFLGVWAGFFTPLHVCGGISSSVVCPPAAAALLMILISWSNVFEYKTVIKCIEAPCQMVTKCTKVMYEKGQQWLLDLSLPECIKAKFKKMPEEKSSLGPGVPMEPV